MIVLPNLNGKNVWVIGLGKTGMSVFNTLKISGANIFVYDDTVCNSEFGKFNSIADLENMQKPDLIVFSPGICTFWPNKHPIAEFASRNFISCVSDLDLFSSVIDTQKITAITGTNGKSTTTKLVHHILTQSIENVAIGGNIGVPMLQLEMTHSNYVLELSSYQLSISRILNFGTSVLLNITPDHLNRHAGIHGYIEAKTRIFNSISDKNIKIISVDDNYCIEIANFFEKSGQKIIKISGQNIPDDGIGWMGNSLIDRTQPDLDAFITDAIPDFDGIHNRQNIAAAYAACKVRGITPVQFSDGLKNFIPLEHRQQIIYRHSGITFIDDSKATNADATQFALSRFENIFWILGGRQKEGGIDSLVHFFPKIKHAFLIGECAENFKKLFDGHKVPNTISYTLEQAVRDAHKSAIGCCNQASILLSPACASFDQFKNFEQRGEAFKKYVLNIAKD